MKYPFEVILTGTYNEFSEYEETMTFLFKRQNNDISVKVVCTDKSKFELVRKNVGKKCKLFGNMNEDPCYLDILIRFTNIVYLQDIEMYED